MASSILTNPTVSLRQGTFWGTTNHTSLFPQLLEIFLGIPYALAPTEDRRFRPPVRVKASTETFDAKHWGPRCPSGSLLDPEVPEGEDCLNLNVFRPSLHDQTSALPVLVYIHGGSFNFGYAKAAGVPSTVAWSPEPFIGVSFNYRIGALGFLPSRVTARDGALNLGLKDQSLLLEWVQENIAAFGGNPDDVTLMGCSAGAHSIGHHLMANTSKKPLFHKAIMDSGAPTARNIYPYDHPLHERQFEEFIQRAGVKNTNESRIMSHLRLLPISTLVSASTSIYDKYNPSLRWAFQPVIDGPEGYITRPPIQKWRSGDWHKMPILTGFNTNEGAEFVPATMSRSSEFRDFFHTLLPSLSDSDLDTLESIYKDPLTHPLSSPYVETRPGLGAQYKRVEAAYGQFAYISPIRHTAYFVSATPSAQSSVYLYHFALRKSVNWGASHADQMDFINHRSRVVNVSKTLQEIAGTMHAYYTSFIVSGDPNVVKGRWPDRPHWPMYRAGDGQIVVFGEGNTECIGGTDTGTSAKIVPDKYAEKECEFWWSKESITERKREEKL